MPWWAWVALATAVAAGVAVVEIGMNEQALRRIPAAASATVARHVGLNETGAMGPISVTPAEANRLVDQLNALPHFPSGTMHCGAGLPWFYVVNFVAVHGSPVDVSVDVGPCVAVTVSSDGEDWDWG